MAHIMRMLSIQNNELFSDEFSLMSWLRSTNSIAIINVMLQKEKTSTSASIPNYRRMAKGI